MSSEPCLEANAMEGRHVLEDLQGYQITIEVFWDGDAWRWRTVDDDASPSALGTLPPGPFNSSLLAFLDAEAWWSDPESEELEVER